MRKILYILILTTLFFVPLQRVNVGELEPICALAIYSDDNRIVIETDTGAKGSGSAVAEAVRDLKERASSVIYLDTAQYLFVEPGLDQEKEAVMRYLKPGIEVYRCDAAGLVSECAEYVSVHGKMPVIGGIQSKKK